MIVRTMFLAMIIFVLSFYSATAQIYQIDTLLTDLKNPWSLVFGRDGSFFIGEKQGDIVYSPSSLNGERKQELFARFPDAIGIDGAEPFDIVWDHQGLTVCYARWTTDKRGAGAPSAVAVYYDGKIVFQQDDIPFDNGHFWGCRLTWVSPDVLIVALGARSRDGSIKGEHLGQVIRIEFPSKKVFTLTTGHRNPEGLVFGKGVLYETEHGPRGGDELNVIQPGKDYGWPEVGHGIGYDGAPIMKFVTRPGVTEPIWYWAPSIAPSGLAYYDANLFPDWKGNLFVGGLVSKSVHRIDMKDGRPVGEERIEIGERVRDVRVGPDGAIYVLTDGENGKLLRIGPSNRPPGRAF